MPKAEVGSTKYIGNKLKQKGLGRLRWYCQVCEKQCRDANGFKMHTQSESHVRQMLIVGEDPKKYINEFSNDFQKDFLQLLKTGHGDKQVHINHFYQEYISNKEHIHMNSTKWPSLTEFAKYLGREGLCRVEETEKGIHISYIDRSPEALRRQDALKRKELQDQGDGQIEQRLIREQIRRAQANAEPQDDQQPDEEKGDRGLKSQDGGKITLSFGAKPAATTQEAPSKEEAPTQAQEGSSDPPEKKAEAPAAPPSSVAQAAPPTSKPTPVSISFGAKPQSKNVFAQAKSKNALSGGSKKRPVFEQPKKMSEAERIMKEEMDRKRSRGPAGFGMPPGKKHKS